MPAPPPSPVFMVITLPSIDRLLTGGKMTGDTKLAAKPDAESPPNIRAAPGKRDTSSGGDNRAGLEDLNDRRPSRGGQGRRFLAGAAHLGVNAGRPPVSFVADGRGQAPHNRAANQGSHAQVAARRGQRGSTGPLITTPRTR